MPGDVPVHIVDDDEAIRESLAFLLAAADLAPQTHATALAFLDKVDPDRPACVVTDLQMPGMSGIDLLREIAARRLPIRVIAMTGHGDLPRAVEALRLGAFDFLEKPFRDEDLLESVGRAIAPPTSESEAVQAAEVRVRLSEL